MSYRGDPIHMEAVRASGAANTTFLLYKAGSATAFTLASTQYISITDIIFISTSGGTYAIVADTDAAGRRVAKGNADALGGLAHHFEEPYVCPVGVTPVLIAADGIVACTMQGFLTDL